MKRTTQLAIIGCLAGTSPALCATATFVRQDTTTQGSWINASTGARTYGADGYLMWGDNAAISALPGYISGIMFPGFLAYVWRGPSTANPVRNLQIPVSPYTTRIAAGWYAHSGNTITVNVTDNAPHLMAVYCEDSDATDRLYLAKYEVTKAMWDEVRTWGLSNGYTDLPTGGGKAADHPVQMVSWHDVVKWCNARSQRENLTPCYTVSGATYKTGSSAPLCNWSASGYRLATEAEWEKAARGGAVGLNFPWGNTISHSQAKLLCLFRQWHDERLQPRRDPEACLLDQRLLPSDLQRRGAALHLAGSYMGFRVARSSVP